MHRVFLQLLPLLLIAGCDAQVAGPSERPTAPAPTRPSPTTTRPLTAPADAARVPILYVYPTGIRPLAQATVDALLAAAAGGAPAREGRRPWFIAVHQNRRGKDQAGHEDPRYYRVMLYFAPDAQAPRLRTGRYLSLWWWTGKRPDERRYVQVSRPNRPFGDQLEVPAVADLPYELQASGEEPPGEPRWVEFVDFARSVLETGGAMDDQLPPYLITRSRRKPGVYGLARGTDEGGDSVVGVWKRDGFVKEYDTWWSGSPWGDL